MSLAQLNTDFDALYALAESTKTKITTLNGVGACPVAPDPIVSDAALTTWNNAVTAWSSAKLTATNNVEAAVELQIAQEKLIASLMVPNVTYKLATLANWSEDVVYISIPQAWRYDITDSNALLGCTFFILNATTVAP